MASTQKYSGKNPVKNKGFENKINPAKYGKNSLLQRVQKAIRPESVLLFDLDDTLVYTGRANFLAYKQALGIVLGREPEINYRPGFRFDRGRLPELFPLLSPEQFKLVISLKEALFPEYLPFTVLNRPVFEVLQLYHKTNRTLLVTNSRENRAKQVLSHHGLADYFTQQFYKPEAGVKKYAVVLSALSADTSSVIIFEDEQAETESALNLGIPKTQIFNIQHYENFYY